MQYDLVCVYLQPPRVQSTTVVLVATVARS